MFAALIPWGDGGMGDWGNGMAPFGQINAWEADREHASKMRARRPRPYLDNNK